MAFKHLELVSFTFLISLLFASIGINAKGSSPSVKTPSPFDFIKNLKGCHRGNHTNDIRNLKAYLERFGYLNYPNKTLANNDNFDETLESAVKTYQKNYNIKPSGIIDDATISTMTTSRCGVPDIVNNTNYMHPRKRNQESSSSHIHTLSHYTFFSGNPRWPPTKTLLTYRFPTNFPPAAIGPVNSAFQKWDAATRFSFSRVGSSQVSDLVVEFHRGAHGDGNPFDGPGGTLAHAFPPTNGRFHYDADEMWSVVADANAFHLETIAIHEIGHLLGLDHSSVPEAIMAPTFSPGEVKNLHPDDIEGIRALYA